MEGAVKVVVRHLLGVEGQIAGLNRVFPLCPRDKKKGQKMGQICPKSFVPEKSRDKKQRFLSQGFLKLINLER